MRRMLPLLIALSFLAVSQVSAQEIPPRFGPLLKNDRFRLVRVLGTPEMPPIYHQASAFSAQGNRAVYAEDLTSGSDDTPRLRTRLLVWDLPAKSWPREITIDGKNVTALALSADGSKALLAGQVFVGTPRIKDKKEKDKDADPEKDYRAYLSLWDLNTGKEIHGFSTKDNVIQCVALAPDATTALAGSIDAVKRWDLAKGKELASFKEPKSASLAFLPNGGQFLAGYVLGKTILWDIAKDKPVRVFDTKKDLVLAWWLAVSRDGKRFAVGDAEKSVSLFETDTGKNVNTLDLKKFPPEDLLTGLALADDGKTVLIAWAKATPEPDDFACTRLLAWDAETMKTSWTHTVPYRGRVPIVVQGEKLLIGGGPNLFDLWNVKTGILEQTWGAHKAPVNALAVLADGDVLSAGPEGAVITWRQGQHTDKRAVHAGAIIAMTTSRDQKHWLTAGADRTIKLWNGAAKPVHTFKGHSGPVTSLAFSKDRRWACSGATDRSVKTWDLEAGKEIATLLGHSDSVNAVAVSPDDRWIASASDDAAIRVWPVKDGKLDPDREPLLLEGHQKPVGCLAFSPDGKTLLSGSQDQTLKVWDWAKEKVVRTIPGHKNWVTSLLFIDDATVLSTSDDLSICLWEVSSGKEIGRIDFGAVSDCPRCVTRIGPDRLLVGTSNWLIYELQMLPPAKSKGGAGSSS